MFTLENIYAAFDKVSGSNDYASFFKELKQIGVSHYDNFVEDGHTEYFDKKGNTVKSDAKYKSIEIGHENAMTVTSLIEKQRKGEIDYDTFCTEAAKNGVQKWKTDLENMRVIYYNASGESIFQEPVAVE